jgi:hypothetical protein
MIETIALASAAYTTIKTAIQQGKELYDCADDVFAFFSAKRELQNKVNDTPLDKRNTLKEFLELEKIKEQEQQLKELMIYSGRGGMWDDWLKFQADAKKQRDDAINAEKARCAKKLKVIKEVVYGGVIALSILCAVGIIGFMFWWISQQSK